MPITFNNLMSLWPFILPLVAGIAGAYPFACGVLASRDFASREENRIVPQGPWYFFDLKFAVWETRLAIAIIPWALFSTFFFWLPLEPWNLIPDNQDEFMRALLPAFVIMGNIGFTWALIFDFAPKFERPLMLTFASGLIFSIGWITASIFMTFIAFVFFIGSSGTWGPWMIFGLYGVSGWLYFLHIWHHVRSKLDRTWFRFDD